MLATTGSSQTTGIDTILVLESLNDAGCAEAGEVPVVADVLAADGHIVGIAFDEHLVVLVVGDDLGDLGEGLSSLVGDLIRAGAIEHVVVERDIDHAFQHLYIDVLEFFLRKGTGEIVGEYDVERVAFRLGVGELLDVLVGSIDLIDKLGDVGTRLVDALVERLLEGVELFEESCIVGTCLVQTLFEALAARLAGGKGNLCIVELTCQ